MYKQFVVCNTAFLSQAVFPICTNHTKTSHISKQSIHKSHLSFNFHAVLGLI